jgi:hypothetical protein
VLERVTIDKRDTGCHAVRKQRAIRTMRKTRMIVRVDWPEADVTQGGYQLFPPDVARIIMPSLARSHHLDDPRRKTPRPTSREA